MVVVTGGGMIVYSGSLAEAEARAVRDLSGSGPAPQGIVRATNPKLSPGAEVRIGKENQ